MESPSKFRIVAFPFRGIAYNEGLYAAFMAQGAEVIDGQWAGRWLLENLRADDVVHIHWPSFLYVVRKGLWASWLAFLRFLLLLGIARLRSREIWWTAHNLMPHAHAASRFPLFDRLGRHLVVRTAKRIFAHGKHACALVIERFPSAKHKLVQIPHGHWIDFYPPCESREAARRSLHVAQDAFVFLIFGQCHPYKNVDGVVEAFRRLKDPRLMLLIAGRFGDAGYLARVRELVQADGRIRIEDRFIPDEQVSAYLMAADAMCMPYRDILTSGTAMLALSYGKPVLSIRKGFLQDVINAQSGILLETATVDAIAEGMRRMSEQRWDAQRILEHCRMFSFEAAARLSMALLRPR